MALAGLHRLGADIPWSAALGGVLGILLAAWALGDALTRAARTSHFPWPAATGLTAGGLLALAPLLWLVLGMEGLPTLGVTLLAFWFANRRQDSAAAVLLGGAMVLRFDAAAAAAAWGVLLLLRRRWQAWPALALCGGTALALYGLMHFGLGVPLPSTLGSKQAQVALGITGFFPNASYLDGAAWVATGYWRRSPWAMGLLARVGAGGKPAWRVSWLPGAAASQPCAPTLSRPRWAFMATSPCCCCGQSCTWRCTSCWESRPISGTTCLSSPCSARWPRLA